jgi:hypothetical protein
MYLVGSSGISQGDRHVPGTARDDAQSRYARLPSDGCIVALIRTAADRRLRPTTLSAASRRDCSLQADAARADMRVGEETC